VTVDQVAVAFKMSERQAQRLVIEYEMPRISRGEYDLNACLVWYAAFLHKKFAVALDRATESTRKHGTIRTREPE